MKHKISLTKLRVADKETGVKFKRKSKGSYSLYIKGKIEKYDRNITIMLSLVHVCSGNKLYQSKGWQLPDRILLSGTQFYVKVLN